MTQPSIRESASVEFSNNQGHTFRISIFADDLNVLSAIKVSATNDDDDIRHGLYVRDISLIEGIGPVSQKTADRIKSATALEFHPETREITMTTSGISMKLLTVTDDELFYKFDLHDSLVKATHKSLTNIRSVCLAKEEIEQNIILTFTNDESYSLTMKNMSEPPDYDYSGLSSRNETGMFSRFICAQMRSKDTDELMMKMDFYYYRPLTGYYPSERDDEVTKLSQLMVNYAGSDSLRTAAVYGQLLNKRRSIDNGILLDRGVYINEFLIDEHGIDSMAMNIIINRIREDLLSAHPGVIFYQEPTFMTFDE